MTSNNTKINIKDKQKNKKIMNDGIKVIEVINSVAGNNSPDYSIKIIDDNKLSDSKGLDESNTDNGDDNPGVDNISDDAGESSKCKELDNQISNSFEKECAFELFYDAGEIQRVFVKKFTLPNADEKCDLLVKNFIDEFTKKFSDFIKAGNDFKRFFMIKPLTQKELGKFIDDEVRYAFLSEYINKYEIKINGYRYELSDFFDSSDADIVPLSKFAMAVILRSDRHEIDCPTSEKIKNTYILDFFNSKYPDYKVKLSSGRVNSARMLGEVYELSLMNSERYDEYIENSGTADCFQGYNHTSIENISVVEGIERAAKSIAGEDKKMNCDSLKKNKTVISNNYNEESYVTKKYAAVISDNNSAVFEKFASSNFGESFLHFKKFDEKFKNALKKFDICFIIYDISNSDEAVLLKFYKAVETEHNPEKNFPPVIFAVSEFKIKMIEEQVIEAKYPKFYGLFRLEEIVEEGKNKKIVELINNYLENTSYFEDIERIGGKCKVEILDIDCLTEFYRKNKFSSLFIGKNRFELLRLRNELIKLKSLFENMRKELWENEYYCKQNMTSLIKAMANSTFKVPSCFLKDGKKWNGFSILIKGETGTGKSLVVDWIKEFLNKMIEWPRQIDVKGLNCSNYTAELFDSSFFGMIDKAATDVSLKTGIALNSIGNIMFLDEIGQLLPQCQAKLLTYLQNFEITPGGYFGQALYVPNIIVAATNEAIEPEDDVSDEKRKKNKKSDFREDLYHRFKFKLEILPLRERREDLAVLIDYVLQNPEINPLIEIKIDSKLENELKKYNRIVISNSDNQAFTYEVVGIANDAHKKLMSYNYPGNFREFEIILRDAVSNAVYENSKIIKLRHLSDKVRNFDIKKSLAEISGEKKQLEIKADIYNYKNEEGNKYRKPIIALTSSVQVKPESARTLKNSKRISKNGCDEIEKQILKLCDKIAVTKNEIAKKIGLTPKYVSENYLSRLVKCKKLNIEFKNNDRRSAYYISAK